MTTRVGLRRQRATERRPFGQWLEPHLPEIAVAMVYVFFACWLLSLLLPHPFTHYLSDGVQDQPAFEWYYGTTAHSLAELKNPLFSDRQNFPLGVNMMANASQLGLGVPLAPITWLFGAPLTFLLVEWLGIAATAFAWYWFMRRNLDVGRAAAFVGGWFCAFGPPMVSHANAHPNFVVHFLIPVILDRVIRLARDGRTVRDGVVLGLLVAWQVFIGEEALLLAALGFGVVGLVLLAHRKVDLRRLAPGVGLGALVCLVVVGGALWWQFRGPQSYGDLWLPEEGADLAALWGRPSRSWFVDPAAPAALSMNRTEENAFFGLPLMIAAPLVIGALWRRAVVRGIALAGVLAIWLSLGPNPILHGEELPIPSLWKLADNLPLIGHVLTPRWTLVLVPLLGILLALLVQTIADAPVRGRVAELDAPVRRAVMTIAGLTAALLLLLPVLPTRLPAEPRATVPPFFAGQTWQRYVDDGSVLVVPPPHVGDARALEWQNAAGMGFPLVEGYFVGPNGQPDRTGQYGATRRPFSQWLADITENPSTPRPITPEERTTFRQDLQAWRTDVVVLPIRFETPVLKASIDGLLGPGRLVDGVYLWDVRQNR